jgi:hypothetical protein
VTTTKAGSHTQSLGLRRASGCAVNDNHATPKKVTLDNLTLSRKEGFRDTVESPARKQPDMLTVQQIRALSATALQQYNHERSVWHANLPTIKTAQLLALHEDLWVIVNSNQQDGEKAKGAVAIEGPAGVGKSIATIALAGEFHRKQIAEHGRLTEAGDERWPVCRVGMTGNTGMKDFNRAMIGFYNHAGTKRGTTADFADRALDCVLACQTKLLIVDFTDRN